MLNLFGLPTSTTSGIASVPFWDYLKTGLQQNLQLTTTYYRRFPVRIDSSHLLVKLLNAVGVLKNQPVDLFYNYLSSRGLKAAMACRMTSSISKGELFQGVFYGPDCHEIIIAHDDDFDPVWVSENWTTLRPIQVLHHPYSDLGLYVPNGQVSSLEEGLAVIAINVPMLAIQYREFYNRETEIAETSGENPRSIMHFLGAYPINHMLYSQLDVTLVNRLYNLSFGIPLSESVKKHPFYLTNYEDKLNQVQEQYLEILSRKNQNFNGVLSSIPMVTASNLLEFSKVPDMAPTRQVIWGLILSRLKLLALVSKLSQKSSRTMSGSEANQLLKLFTLYNTDKVFQAALPPDLYFDAKHDIDEIVQDL